MKLAFVEIDCSMESRPHTVQMDLRATERFLRIGRWVKRKPDSCCDRVRIAWDARSRAPVC